MASKRRREIRESWGVNNSGGLRAPRASHRVTAKKPPSNELEDLTRSSRPIYTKTMAQHIPFSQLFTFFYFSLSLSYTEAY